MLKPKPAMARAILRMVALMSGLSPVKPLVEKLDELRHGAARHLLVAETGLRERETLATPL
jgi:hypothetical protein